MFTNAYASYYLYVTFVIKKTYPHFYFFIFVTVIVVCIIFLKRLKTHCSSIVFLLDM